MWCLDQAIEVVSRGRYDQSQPFGFTRDALQVVIDVECSFYGAAFHHGSQKPHEVAGLEDVLAWSGSYLGAMLECQSSATPLKG